MKNNKTTVVIVKDRTPQSFVMPEDSKDLARAAAQFQSAPRVRTGGGSPFGGARGAKHPQSFEWGETTHRIT